jgi:predicted ATPase
VLGLGAEREYPVPPLPLPPDPTSATVGELAAAPAVELFVDRARRVRPGFVLTPDNAGAVAEICRRLDGVPLAIELAAARTRLLDPGALLARLTRSMDALGTGPVDMPERQRTLRATVEWSVGLLDDSERSLLEIVAIFADGWTVDAAARVADLDEDEALELTEALARHSLIQLDHTDLGPRCRMLETVREFISERLANRADADVIARRHADFYRALADQADRPLRAARAEMVERMDAERGNVAAAVRWHLAHDPAPLPHLFRVLWPFWFLRGHPEEGRVRQRVEQLLPIVGSLGRQAEEELLGRRARAPPTWATIRPRRRSASAWNHCCRRSATRSSPRWLTCSWPGARRSPATSSRPCTRPRPAWTSYVARMSHSSRRSPSSPPRRSRRRWAATTRPCAT